MTDIRAQTSSGGEKKKREAEDISVRAAPVSASFCRQNEKLKGAFTLTRKGGIEHERDVAYNRANVGVAEFHVTRLPAWNIRDSKFRELFIRNCDTHDKKSTTPSAVYFPI